MADVEEAAEAAGVASDLKTLLPQGFDGVEGGPPGAALSLAGARPAPSSAPAARAHVPASQTWVGGSLHLTAAVVGVGILALPHALAALGRAAGTLALITAGGVSLYTALLLSRVAAAVPAGGGGAPPATYADVADRALGSGDGRSAARRFVSALQGVACVGLGIAYSVSAGTSLAGAVAAAGRAAPGAPPRAPPTRTALAVGCAAFGALFCAPLSLVPDFASLTWVSAAGAVASAFYSTAAVVAAARVRAAGGPPGGRARPPEPPHERTWAALSALGTIIFAFGGHVIVPEVQASLAAPGAMVPALWAGYGAVAVAYSAVTAAGAAAWGGAAAEDVLLSPGAGPPWLMASANIAVLLHVAAGYQIFSQPVFAGMGRAWARRQQRRGGGGGEGGGGGAPGGAVLSGNGRSPAPSPAPSMDGEGGLAASAAATAAASAPTTRPRGWAGGPPPPLGRAGAGGGAGRAPAAAFAPSPSSPPPPPPKGLPAALIATRLAYVATTTILAAAAPFIAEVMSLIGAAVFTPLTFVLPPLFAVALSSGGSGGVRASAARALHLAIAGGFTVAGAVCAVAAARGLFTRARA